jgi:hypothetical protein
MNAQQGIRTMIVVVSGMVSLWMLGNPALSEGQSLIHACVNNKGALRIVEPGSNCTAKEHLLTWPAEPSPDEGPNVAQVDRVSAWVCPASTTTPPTFTGIPDLALSLTTQGGPLLMMVIIDTPTFWGGGEGILFEPVINGQQMSGDRLSISRTNNWLWPFSFTRVYLLPAGTYTLSASLACLSNPASLGRAWLTAYELR